MLSFSPLPCKAFHPLGPPPPTPAESEAAGRGEKINISYSIFAPKGNSSGEILSRGPDKGLSTKFWWILQRRQRRCNISKNRKFLQLYRYDLVELETCWKMNPKISWTIQPKTLAAYVPVARIHKRSTRIASDIYRNFGGVLCCAISFPFSTC